MSVKVSALCWKVRLPPTEKLVLLRLADFADDRGFNIYPAVQTIVDDTGCSERAVQMALRKLVASDILVVMNQGGGRGRSTEYAIDLDHLEQLKSERPKRERNYNGHTAKGANGANPAADAPFQNPAKGAKGANNDINPAADAPHPLEPSVKEEETVCSVGVDPREAPTQTPPTFSKNSNVVPIKPDSRPGVLPLPERWLLPDEWRAWAAATGQQNIDGAAQRFFDFHFERGLRKTEAGWRHAWERWINENIERGYGNGAGRNNHQRRANGDLAAVVQSDLPGWFGYAEGGSDG